MFPELGQKYQRYLFEISPPTTHNEIILKTYVFNKTCFFKPTTRRHKAQKVKYQIRNRVPFEFHRGIGPLSLDPDKHFARLVDHHEFWYSVELNQGDQFNSFANS